MKRKFEETDKESYTEARNLVFNISIGKLQTGPTKPVEPSLWRSLLIIKTLHRIADELNREATVVASNAARDEKSACDLLSDDPLEAIFCLQNAPVAVLLSDGEIAASGIQSKPDSIYEEGPEPMDFDETSAKESSLMMLSTYLAGSGVANASVGPDCEPFGVTVSSGFSNVVGSEEIEHDNFADIDCSCLDSFSQGDLSDISVSMEREFLLESSGAFCL